MGDRRVVRLRWATSAADDFVGAVVRVPLLASLTQLREIVHEQGVLPRTTEFRFTFEGAPLNALQESICNVSGLECRLNSFTAVIAKPKDVDATPACALRTCGVTDLGLRLSRWSSRNSYEFVREKFRRHSRNADGAVPPSSFGAALAESGLPLHATEVARLVRALPRSSTGDVLYGGLLRLAFEQRPVEVLGKGAAVVASVVRALSAARGDGADVDGALERFDDWKWGADTGFRGDKTGTVTRGQLREGLAELGVILPRADVELLVAELGTVGTDRVRYRALLERSRGVSLDDVMTKLQRKLRRLSFGGVALRRAFERFDQRGTGRVGFVEFRDALRALGDSDSASLTESECRRVFERFGAKGTGEISYAEFSAFVERGLCNLESAAATTGRGCQGGARWMPLGELGALVRAHCYACTGPDAHGAFDSLCKIVVNDDRSERSAVSGTGNSIKRLLTKAELAECRMLDQRRRYRDPCDVDSLDAGQLRSALMGLRQRTSARPAFELHPADATRLVDLIAGGTKCRGSQPSVTREGLAAFLRAGAPYSADLSRPSAVVPTTTDCNDAEIIATKVRRVVCEYLGGGGASAREQSSLKAAFEQLDVRGRGRLTSGEFFYGASRLKDACRPRQRSISLTLTPADPLERITKAEVELLWRSPSFLQLSSGELTFRGFCRLIYPASCESSRDVAVRVRRALRRAAEAATLASVYGALLGEGGDARYGASSMLSPVALGSGLRRIHGIDLCDAEVAALCKDIGPDVTLATFRAFVFPRTLLGKASAHAPAPDAVLSSMRSQLAARGVSSTKLRDTLWRLAKSGTLTGQSADVATDASSLCAMLRESADLVLNLDECAVLLERFASPEGGVDFLDLCGMLELDVLQPAAASLARRALCAFRGDGSDVDAGELFSRIASPPNMDVIDAKLLRRLLPRHSGPDGDLRDDANLTVLARIISPELDGRNVSREGFVRFVNSGALNEDESTHLVERARLLLRSACAAAPPRTPASIANVGQQRLTFTAPNGEAGLAPFADVFARLGARNSTISACDLREGMVRLGLWRNPAMTEEESRIVHSAMEKTRGAVELRGFVRFVSPSAATKPAETAERLRRALVVNAGCASDAGVRAAFRRIFKVPGVREHCAIKGVSAETFGSACEEVLLGVRLTDFERNAVFRLVCGAAEDGVSPELLTFAAFANFVADHRPRTEHYSEQGFPKNRSTLSGRGIQIV